VGTAKRGDSLVAVLVGQLDLGTKDALTQAVADVLTDDIRTVELDVARLAFCDSPGLAALVGLHHAAGAEGKYLYLSEVSSALARVLEIVGLQWLADPPPEAVRK
jgi:anti-sigma B factor antagonist